MVRIMSVLLAVLIVLPSLILPASDVRAAEEEDNVYIVKPGDTLSGIAAEVLGDWRRWSELLEVNPQIPNPEMIYPGDTLVLPSGEGMAEPAAAGAVPESEKLEESAEPISISKGGELEESDREVEAFSGRAEVPSEISAETAAEGAEVVAPVLPVEVFRPLPVINDNIYRTSGYISKDLPGIAVVSSVADKTGHGEGDEIFLGTVAEEGALYTIVRPVKRVYHPQSGEYLGWLIGILGWAEVNCAGEVTSRAMLHATVSTIEIGDLAIPFDAEDVLEKNIIGEKQSKFCLTKTDEGRIVATQEGKVAHAEGDVVFLDRGKDAGVEPGDMFVVYREIDADAIVVTAQLQILRTGESTSTALVIHSMEEIEVDDLVQSWVPESIGDSSSGG